MSDTQIGTVINKRYRLDAELGRGGMGVVYRAHDTLLERDVAVKVMSAAALGSKGRARLLHEAQSAARLNHPNIVSVHDAGEADPSTGSGPVLQARRLMAEAGYPGGRGFPVAEALMSSQENESLSKHLRAQWQENLGVEITWQPMEHGAWVERVLREPPSISFGRWYADYPDPDNFPRISTALWLPGWQNEAYDGLVVEGARRVMDQEERMRMYQQADRILVEEAPILPLVYARLHLLVKPWVRKYPTSPMKAWFWKDVIIEPH